MRDVADRRRRGRAGGSRAAASRRLRRQRLARSTERARPSRSRRRRSGRSPPPSTSSTATSPATAASRGIDQGGDTVGEGQAYGMLMAAAIGDSRRFDTIWDWTQNNLQRPDGLISFLWRDGHVVDPQAASDADLDASRALLVAACRFHRPALRQEALALGERDHADRGRLSVVPGPPGADGRSVGDHAAAGHGRTPATSRPPRSLPLRAASKRPPLGRPGGELARRSPAS